MSVRIREINNINILDIDGRIDINSSDIIETVGWLTNTGRINIIMNMENVDIVDYSGLSILAIAYKNVMNHKGRMKFLHVGLPVQELFKVVKLDVAFEVFSDEESAVESFSEEDVEKLKMRRKFKRLDIHLNIKYKISGDKKKNKAYTGEILNISAAGLYLYTKDTLPMNTIIDMEISMPGKKAPLHTNGKVIYLADKEIQPHAYPGMGISFSHLTPEKERAIIDFIDKNIINRAETI